MTKAQIIYVLSELNSIEDQWIPLEGVTLINLAILPRIYTDPNTMRFKFNTTTENLEIVYGNKTPSGFTSLAGETDNYTAQTFVRFDIVMALHRSITSGSIYGTYYKKGFWNTINYKTN
jgi:hypothetical protein